MKMSTKTKLLLSAVTAASFAATAAPTYAQDIGDGDDLIVVTGSRIAKKDFISNSPVVTIGAEQFDLTGTVNTESLLNTLPQVVPGLDRTSNNPGGGIATVDLRGLGTARTLVLVNGQRFIPTTGGGTVDINNIPTALVKDVEVVTGGASAVYGSDAVAGVVNFVLKDDFEGFEGSTGYEITERGDAEIFSASATFGGNFADDRGNVVFNAAYTDRNALFQGDRSFSEFDQDDDGTGEGFVNGGSSGVPEGRIGGIFDGGAAIFEPDGSIRPFEGTDLFNFNPTNFLQLPQERIQFSSLAHFDVTDRLRVKASGLFARNEVNQQLAPTPIFEPRGGTINASLDGNPFITPEAQQLISDAVGAGVDTDGDGIDDEFTQGAFGFRRRLVEVGPRQSNNEFSTFQVSVGAELELSDTWTFDLNVTEGRSNGTENQNGNVNVGRFNQSLLLADADGDGNVDVDANGNPSCADPSNNGGVFPCAPLNLFGLGNISEEAANFIRTLAVIDQEYELTNVTANFVGDTSGLFELPGGPIGLAIGGEYRDEFFSFNPSQDVAASTISGFNGAPPVSGEFDVVGVYGEAYLPILKDVPFAETLALEVAARYEDYSTAGEVDAYKIAGEWAPNEQIRLRASYNTAVRAPSITELFSPQGENFPGASDPCSAIGSPAGGVSAAISAICTATGVPAANVGSSNIDLPSGQVREISGGNPDLLTEDAETFTIGAVISPNFIEGLTLTVDYFDITIDDAIANFGGGANNVISTCFEDTELGGVGSPFCNAITRGPDGLITEISVTSQNVASRDLEGFDIGANYTHDLGNLGLLGFVYNGTITDTSTLVPFEGGEPIVCAGNFGENCGEPLPDYKHRLTTSWANGPFKAQVVWRYIGSTGDDGGLDPQVLTVTELDAENYFDASGIWDINDNFSLTAGIDNLFDKNPPILGNNQEQANTFPATFDVFGRTYFARATARF